MVAFCELDFDLTCYLLILFYFVYSSEKLEVVNKRIEDLKKQVGIYVYIKNIS